MDFAPGDVVERWRINRCDICGFRKPPVASPHQGAFTVTAVTHNGLGLRFAEAPLPYGSWCAAHYCKINRADEQFTAKIKACRPIRQPERV